MLNIIEELIKDDTQPCISLIIPTHRTSPDRRVDPLEVRKVVQEAKELLFIQHGRNGTMKMATALDALVAQTDFNHSDLGVGFFVSHDRATKIDFPFPVKEHVHISHGFEVRQLLQMVQEERPFYILSLTEKEIRLFWGTGKGMREINDANFPFVYTDDYEYAKPSPGNSFASGTLKSPEKDKSVIGQIRYTAFLKTLDEALTPYLEKEIPMIVAGVDKAIGAFNAATKHKKQIAGEVSGNYQHNKERLILLAQVEMIAYYEQEEQKLMELLDDATGRGLAAAGLPDVWRSATLGKGHILLVEKDFTVPAFTAPEEDLELHMAPLPGKHNIIPDAVDALIKRVMSKNGKVHFVQNGRLAESGRVALIKRFQ